MIQIGNIAKSHNLPFEKRMVLLCIYLKILYRPLSLVGIDKVVLTCKKVLLIFIEIFPEKIVQFFTDFPLFGIMIFWKMTRITNHLARKSPIPMISHKQVSP